MNTADIFSLLHLFHLFTFLWHRPTLPKPYVGKARPKALVFLHLDYLLVGREWLKTMSFINSICPRIRLSTRQQMW